MTEDDLRRAIFARVAKLRTGSSCCPSLIARDLDADWRPLMQPLRRAALAMAAEGLIRITQGGCDAGPDPRGPIRLARR